MKPAAFMRRILLPAAFLTKFWIEKLKNTKDEMLSLKQRVVEFAKPSDFSYQNS